MGEAIGSGRSVLLVEDDPLQARLVRAQLHDAGYRVFLAEDAESALRIAVTRAPDVVLSDVIMRETDGFTLCRSLRSDERSAQIPVLLMSAHFQDQRDRALAAAVGAEALVQRTPGFGNELEALSRVLAARPQNAVIDHDVENLYHECVTNQLSLLLSRAENADARFRMIFRHSHDVLLLLATDGTILEANERARLLFETATRPLVGLSVTDPTLELKVAYDGDATSSSAEVLSSVRLATGEERHFTFMLTRVARAEGDVFLGVGRDVTDRVETQRRMEQSERQYRTLIENIPDVVWAVTMDGTTQFVSRNLERLCGSRVTDLGRRPGSTWLARTHEDDRQRVALAWSRLDLEESFSIEYRWRHEDGTWLWLHERAKVRAGSAERVVDGLISDISERKRLETKLWQSQKMEALGLLTGGIAHDFNNVLAVVLGNSQSLLGDLTANDPRREEVADIERAAKRAANLTRQLLAFARRQVLEPTPTDLNEVLLGVEKMLRHVVRANVALELRRSPALGIVRADIGQVEQVLMNLAVNARDAMPDGGTLLIETENVELDHQYALDHEPMMPGRYVMLAVTDTGVGMDAPTRRRAFEPFFTTKGANGSGLGLASTYGIVKQSGGFIWLYSEPDRGTTFRIYLPRIDEPAREIEQRVEPQMPRGTETVLLVEDDPGLRATLERMVTRLGYKVLVAAHAHEAFSVAIAHDQGLDVILSDIVLPGASGVELVTRLRKFRPAAKVLLMSGYTDHAAQRIGGMIPDWHFLQKPFSIELLARKLREVLDGNRGAIHVPLAES